LAYLADVFIEFLQGALTERVNRSAPSNFDRALDAADRGFIKLLTLFFQFLNELVAFADAILDILDQILFIRPKGAARQYSLKKLECIQEASKILRRSSHISVLALV
jgi:hypothetical protein